MNRYWPVLLLLLLLAACAQKTIPPQKTAAEHLAEGDRHLENRLYDEAIAAYEKVRESYDTPALNIRAEKGIAEAHFQAEHYPEASVAYEDFLKDHPNHPETATILYRLGMAYNKQILAYDRDQTATRNALVTFGNLLARYPGVPEADEITALIDDGRNRLANHELYVGRFYLRTKQPQAAISRLSAIPETYPDFAALDQVYFHLGQAYLKTDDLARARESFALLTDRFPDSPLTSKAMRLLP